MEAIGRPDEVTGAPQISTSGLNIRSVLGLWVEALWGLGFRV